MIATGLPARRRRPMMAVVSLLLGGLGLLSLLNRSASLHGEDGIDWRPAAGRITAARVFSGGAGERAGIRNGDRIRSIDGSEVDSAAQIRERLWGRGGIATEYRVLRDGVERVIEVIPETSAEENRVFYYLWIVAGVGLGAALLAAWHLPAGSGGGSLFLLVTALYALLAFSPGGTGSLLDWILYWGDLAGRLLTPPFLAHFFWVVGAGEGSGADRRRAGWLYLPGALLFLQAITLIPMRGALRFAHPAAAVVWKDRVETLYLAAGSGAALIPLLVGFWGSIDSRRRWRSRWLIATVVAGLLPPVLLYLLPKAVGIVPGPLGEISVFLLALVPLGFAGALLQDRSIGLERSQRVLASVLLAAALFLGSALALSYAGSLLAGGLGVAGPVSEVFLPALISGIVTLAAYPGLSGAVGRILSHRPPLLPAALLDFRDDLNGEIDLTRLARRFEAGLRRAFAMEPVALLVRDGAEGVYRPAGEPAVTGPAPEIRIDPAVGRFAGRELVLIDSDASLPPPMRATLIAEGYRYLFPLEVRGDVGALLLMGGHRDGSPLPDDEAAALAALAAQAARSVEAARLYREIEARSAREEALRRRTQAVLESSRIGILLVDGGGRVSAANGAAEEILGRPKLLRRRLRRLLPPALQERLAGGPDDEARRVYRFPLFTPGGVTRIVNVTRSPLTGGSAGEQVYTLDDVGEEVRREEILERQSHLASMGLIASQVAHEVNTPLTGIASYAQILMSRLRVRPSEMAMLRRIESQAFQAAGIAGSVLNYARRRTGEEPRRIEAGALVAECLSLFEAHIKGKRIRVRSERSPDLPEIVARPGRIQQLILNLLLNAAAALPGGGEVRVEVDREGSALRIRVSDDGVGIPPEIRPRIFEPFFTSRPDGQGTGLGLWVVDQIVREHRGEIRVESAPGAGTRFSVLIPAAGGAEETIAHGA